MKCSTWRLGEFDTVTVSTYPVHWTALNRPGRNCISVRQKVKIYKKKLSKMYLFLFTHASLQQPVISYIAICNVIIIETWFIDKL